MYFDCVVFFLLKTITKGLTIFGETVASSLTGMKSFPTHSQKETVDNEGCRPGVVTIIDIENVGKGQVGDTSLVLSPDCAAPGGCIHCPSQCHCEGVSQLKVALNTQVVTVILTQTDRNYLSLHLF